MLRNIIEIDEDLCTGCGLCIPECHEGALQLIDGKARLISDLFCDGLGACIGHCPEGAMQVVEREAEAYDEKTVMPRIVEQGRNTLIAHLTHLRDHGARQYFAEALEYLEENGLEIPALEEPVFATSDTARPAGVGADPAESAHTGPAGVRADSAGSASAEPAAAEPLPCGCPGSLMRDLTREADGRGAEAPAAATAVATAVATGEEPAAPAVSHLTTWPVQIRLLPVHAPFFAGADLLVTADCVPFAYPALHADYMQGRVVLVGCPKLDDASFYREKFTEIFSAHPINSVTCLRMEVPCCGGLSALLTDAIATSGRQIPLRDIIITIDGEAREV